MNGRRTGRCLVAVTLALFQSLLCQELLGQHRLTPAEVPEGYRGLQRLGDLRLKTYSIHGLAPLVVLFTEAPTSAPEGERRYRHQLTTSLISSIERLGVSLFSLEPARQGSSSPHSDQMKQGATATSAIFRALRPHERPQVFIGFADGAVAAARLLLRDSSSAALVALAPATASDGAVTGQDVLWQELFRPADRPRDVLVLESLCNAPVSWLANARYSDRRTLLILPQYDGWLSPRATSTCPKAPVNAPVMDYVLLSILTDWLKRAISFPE